MKLRITMPNGISKEKEFVHKDEIEIALKRGWKEVPSDKKIIKAVEPKADGAKIIKKAKKKSKKKGKR
tara:strand:- start:420 stop:623 length:204 start_codon:yes stop_codon:yes gene_type:complete